MLGTMRLPLSTFPILIIIMLIPVIFISSFVTGSDIVRGYSGDDNNNISPESVNIVNPRVHSSIDLGSFAGRGTPAFYNGYIYIGDGAGILHCIYEWNMTEKWHYHTAHGGPIYSNIAVNTGQGGNVGDIYFGGYTDEVAYCIKPDGTERWHKFYDNTPNSMWNPIVVPVDQDYWHVYFGCSGGWLLRLNVTDGSGAPVGSTKMGETLNYVSFAYYNGTIVGVDGTGSNGVSCFNITTQNYNWYYKGSVSGQGYYGRGAVFDGTTGFLYLIDQGAVNRLEKRSFATGNINWTLNIPASYEMSPYPGMPIIYGDYVYFVSLYGKIHAVNKYTGLWKTGTNNVTVTGHIGSGADPHFGNAGIMDAYGWWYVLDSHSMLRKINIASMGIVWELNLTGSTTASYGHPTLHNDPALGGQAFIYVCAGNYLYKVGEYSGTVPAPPYLSITDSGSHPPHVNLSWTYPTYNGTAPLMGYVVFRSLDGITYWNVFLITTNTTRTYTDTNVSVGLEYFYYVTAFNSNGNGSASNIVSLIVGSWGPTLSEQFIDKTMMIMAIIIVIALLIFVGSIKKGGK